MRYYDSNGNVYSAISGKEKNGSKGTKKKTSKRRLDKGGRNERRYKAYRDRVGKPNGPGKPGNKSGVNKIKKG